MMRPEMLPTFDEFRRSHDEVLRVQRERLRDDAAAKAVLRDRPGRPDWAVWSDAAYAEAIES